MKRQYGSALPSLHLPSPLQPHQPEDMPHSHGNTVLKNYSVGGTLTSPAHLSPGESQDSSWCFLSKHVEWIMEPPIPVYSGVAGQQECLQVPHHPFTSITWKPPREKHFLTRSKSLGRLPRSIKVKDLIPWKKVKEWIQNLPPTRTATSEAMLIISSDKDSNASLAGNLSEAGIWNSFTLGWWGNDIHSCKGALPSLQLSLHGKIWTSPSEI